MRSKTNVQLTSTPTSALLAPNDNTKILNFINFNTIGSTTINNSNAFKKIQSFSKTTPQDLFSVSSDFVLKYNKLNNLYLNDLDGQDSLFYGTKRQHNYSSKQSIIGNSISQLDNKSVSKLLDYNYNFITTNTTNTTNNLVSDIMVNVKDNLELVQSKAPELGSKNKTINPKLGNNLLKASVNDDMLINSEIKFFNTTLNTLGRDIAYSTIFTKSPNQQILPNDRNLRNIETLNPLKVNYNISTMNTENILNQTQTRFTQTRLPSTYLGNKSINTSFDRFTDTNGNAPLLAAKEELAPNFIFTPF